MIVKDSGTLKTETGDYTFSDDRRIQADIFENVEDTGEPVVRFVARLHETQEALKSEAEGGKSIAESVLEWHRYSGDSRIVVSTGDIDWFVSLDDERGYPAAAAIEFGHTDSKTGEWVPGIGALQAAFPMGFGHGGRRKSRRTRRLR